MPLLSGIYDSEWIQPIARIKENLAILTAGVWEYFAINYQEPIPPGPASTVEMVTLSGATSLAAGGFIAKRVVAVLQVNDFEFLHLRWAPLDNVEGILWEQAGQARFLSRNIHARVDLNTRLWDPHFVSTTFWILGMNRDMNLEVRNPMGYATPIARFIFWGYRYLLDEWDLSKATSDEKKKLRQGDPETAKRIIGLVTWLPAEGKQA